MRCLPNYTLEYLMQNLTDKQIKIAVASNSIRATVNKAIENLRLENFIEFSLSNEDVKNGKPDPEYILRQLIC